jgi:hypothetical protein
MVLVLVIVFRTSTYSATAESHDERPRADPLTLRLTISGLRIARGPRTVSDDRFVGQGR